MFNWFNKKKDPPPVEAAPIMETVAEKPKKPRKPRVKKEKKVEAEKAEPKVDIIKFDFDPQNPRVGSIELDWNTEFVELLIKHGYYGKTEEEVVDLWLNDVCKTIIANQFPGAAANAAALAGATMVNRKKVGDGKTEVS